MVRGPAPPRPSSPGRSPIALRVGLDDGAGFDVTEMGTEKRLALWVVHSPEDVAPLAALGVDPLEPRVHRGRLAGSCSARSRPRVKTALTTQSLIAGVGNAYSDEALHRARLSPYKKANRLDARRGGPAPRRARRACSTEAVDRVAAVDLAELKGDKKRAMAGARSDRAGLPGLR